MSKHSTMSERLEHKALWLQSGLSKKAYCQEAGLKYGTFISWFSKTDSKEGSGSGKFIALNATPQKESGTRKTASITFTSLRIELPNGVQLHTDENLSMNLLKLLSHV